MIDYNFDFDFAAIIILAVVAVYYFKTKHLKDAQHYMFCFLLGCSFLVPITDIIASLMIEACYPWGVVMPINTVYFLSEQGTTYFFLMYIFAHLEMGENLPLKKKIIILLPIGLVAAMILLNPLTGWVFRYSVEGGYQRGIMQTFCYGVAFFYFIWAVYYVTKNKVSITDHIRYLVYNVTIIMATPLIVQLFFQNILLHGFAIAVSMILVLLVIKDHDVVLDTITGMANRSYLDEICNRMLFNRYPFHLILVRIGDYDLLANSYGIANTESLVQEIGKYLSSLVEIGNSFQISNSCFVILYKKTDYEDLERKIYHQLKQEWVINDVEMVCSSFVTVVSYPENFSTMEGISAYLGYFQKMHRMRYGIVGTKELQIKDKMRERKIQRIIKRGLVDGNFSMNYQPICTSADQKFITAEALIRLNDPEEGMISPVDFIPVAEKDGSIIPIGRFVLEEVCKFISKYDMEELGLAYIELNLSTIQCLQRDFIRQVDEITKRYGISSQRICFEITETAANCAPKIFTENLEALRERGFRLALDDFGTGYGNLQRMITTQFDIIKFDKELTETTCADPKLMGLFEKMQAMFHSMGSSVVAEGVETSEQYEFLKEIGCDYIQGYYFSKALTEEEFVAYLLEKKKENVDNF